jgi:hypothetical protein
MEVAMGKENFCSAILQWRSLTACPLLAAALACHVEAADAEENTTPIASWHYRDYLLNNAPPSFATRNSTGVMTQIGVAELLQQRNIDANSNIRKLVLSAGFDNRADWESFRYGVGLFAPLPESGQFHFNLYVRPNAPRPGYRWQLQATGLPVSADAGPQRWSVGGFVDYGRGRDGLRSRIGVAPQLILHLSPLLHMPGEAQASVQYAYWRSAFDNDAPTCRAMQMALRWQF